MSILARSFAPSFKFSIFKRTLFWGLALCIVMFPVTYEKDLSF